MTTCNAKITRSNRVGGSSFYLSFPHHLAVYLGLGRNVFCRSPEMTSMTGRHAALPGMFSRWNHEVVSSVLRDGAEATGVAVCFFVRAEAACCLPHTEAEACGTQLK